MISKSYNLKVFWRQSFKNSRKSSSRLTVIIIQTAICTRALLPVLLDVEFPVSCLSTKILKILVDIANYGSIGLRT